MSEERIYTFGDGNLIYVPNGGYLTPEKIQHYEFCFGKLRTVRYKGKTVEAK